MGKQRQQMTVCDEVNRVAVVAKTVKKKKAVVAKATPERGNDKFRVLEIDADGKCLYNALLYHLKVLGRVRDDLHVDDFKVAIFDQLREEVVREKSIDLMVLQLDTTRRRQVFEDIEDYIKQSMKPKSHGGHAEMLVVASMFNVDVQIHSESGSRKSGYVYHRQYVIQPLRCERDEEGVFEEHMCVRTSERQVVPLLFNGTNHYDALSACGMC